MKIQFQISNIAAFGLALATMLPLAAQADVKIQRFTHFSEVTGITAHDSTTTDYIQGDKEREENLRKFTGSVLGAWQRFRHEDNGSLSVDIFNVGENKHYELDPNKKTFSVEPLYTPGQQEQQFSNSAQPQQQQQQQDNDTKVTKNEFTVKATGKKNDLNGFDTTEYLITWDVETENTKTGEKSKSLMTTDMWNSMDPRLAKAHAEEATYDQAYRKLMHEPSDSSEMQQYGFGTVRINSADQKKFFDKLRTIKGHPVSTDVTWETASTDPNDKSDADRKDDTPSQSVDSALGSLFGSKSKQDDSPKKNDGMTTIFSSHIEIKSVDVGALDRSLFEVPKDYKTE